MRGQLPVLGSFGSVLVTGTTSATQELNDAAPYLELVWETEGKASIPLEIMIQVVTISGTLTAFNLPDRLRWQVLALGHGEAAYDCAPLAGQVAGMTGESVIRFPRWTVPARGVAARLQARALRVGIVNTQPGSSALIRASINPLSAPDSDRWPFPNSDYQPSSERGFFPIGAREWRLLPAGVNDLVEVYGFSADAAPPSLYVVPVTDLSEWTLIAHREYSWVVSANGVAAQYR